MKTYIILFTDGTMQVYNKKMDMQSFQKGARQFFCEDSLPVVELAEWIALGYKHKLIKEEN